VDVESGEVLRRFEGLKKRAHAVAFSPDGKWAAAGDSANTPDGDDAIIVWDAASGEQRCQVADAKQGWIDGLAFSPDGKVLASATPHHVCLWEAASGKQLVEFDRTAANAVAFDAAGKRLVTGGDVCVIDPARREIVRRMGQESDHVIVVALSPDGKTIASNGGHDEHIRLWDAETGKETLPAAHLDEVRSVAVSPDGKRIATASGGDGTVRLWDAARGAEVHTLKLAGELDHLSRGRPVALTFSADGRTLGAAGQFWDVATGKEAEPPRELRGARAVFSADGRTAAVVEAGSDRHHPTAVLRDAATGRLLRRLTSADENGRQMVQGGMAFSPDGRLLATGYAEDRPRDEPTPTDTVRLWDVTTGKPLRSLRPALDVPAQIVFSPDGELLAASGYWQNPPQLWDATDGKEVRRFTGYEDAQRNWDEWNPVAFSPDGALLAAGGKDNVVVLWETATGGVVRVLRGHTRPVRSLAFAPDGRTLVSGGADTTALVWPVAPAGAARKWDPEKTDALWKTLAGEPAAAYMAVWALADAPDGAVAFLKGRLRPDEAVDERQLARWIADLGDNDFEVREQATRRLRDLGARAEPALRKALAGQEDLERRGRLEALLAPLDRKTPDPAVLRDLRAVQALEQRGTPAAEAFLEELARGADGGLRTRAARAALVRLEERRGASPPRPAQAPAAPPQGGEPRRLYSHDGEVYAVAFTPDGAVALSAGRDGKVRRWDVGAGKELPALAGHEGGVFALAVSPDGNRLASAGADGRVRLWDLGTGGEAASLAGHEGDVFAVAFSPDGRLLASGGEDGTVRLWDLEKKEERYRMRASKGRVTTVAFSADGETLMSAGVFESGSTYGGKTFPRYVPEPVRLWKTATGAEVRKLDQIGSAVALRADGKRLLVVRMQTGTVGGNYDELFNVTTGVVSLIDLTTEKPSLVLEGCGGAAALSADGRLLVTTRGSDLHVGDKVRESDVQAGASDLRLWDLLSGQEVLHFPGASPAVLVFAPDGRRLLTGARDGAVCLVETASPDVGADGRPNRQALEALWTDLGSADAAVAYRAEAALVAARDDAPAFLAERLRAAPADDPGLRRLVAELDGERYVVRRAAFAELARRGADAAPALEAALKEAESPTVKARLKELLAAPEAKAFPDPLRRLRAARVLERIGTPEAKRVLADLPPVPDPRDP
jgi:WD40 repeat protein